MLSLAASSIALPASDDSPRVSVRYSATPSESRRGNRVALRVTVAVDNPNEHEIVARLRFSEAAGSSRAETTAPFAVTPHGSARQTREFDVAREELPFWRTLTPPVAIEVRDAAGAWHGVAVPFLNTPIEEAAQ